MTFVWVLAALVAIFLIRVGLRVARRVRVLKVNEAQLAAYRKGDYRAQLQIVEGFRLKGSEPANYLFFRGAGCFELGRLTEAEQCLRLSMAKETNPIFKVLCRDQLGRVFLEQERWDEATACFQEAIAESPKRGGCHRSMAELLLRLGGQDAAALDSARTAEALDRAEPVHPAPGGQEVYNSNLSESLAVLAWALARNQAESSRVNSALSEAFAMSNELAKAIVAELHFFAGNAHAALGNPDESVRHFQTATETDPDGNYGRLARSAARLHTPAN